MAPFEIQWQINDAEWDKARLARQQNAPASDYDTSLTPLYDLLYGSIQFSYGEARLFPDMEGNGKGIRLSLLNIAEEISRTLLTSGFAQAPDGTTTSFTELEFRVTVRFQKQQQVVISSDLVDSQVVTAPQDELLQGARTFLTAFVGEIRQRVPEILEWESAAELRAY